MLSDHHLRWPDSWVGGDNACLTMWMHGGSKKITAWSSWTPEPTLAPQMVRAVAPSAPHYNTLCISRQHEREGARDSSGDVAHYCSHEQDAWAARDTVTQGCSRHERPLHPETKPRQGTQAAHGNACIVNCRFPSSDQGCRQTCWGVVVGHPASQAGRQKLPGQLQTGSN